MDKAQHWEKIKELFAAAVELEPSARTNFLQQACAGDETVLRELESLLQADADPASLSMNSTSGSQTPSGHTPSDIGPYHLVRLLGEGGMGEVWLAEQNFPVKRQLAVKLIRAGWLNNSLLQRFQWERQSLALMDHPCIAKIHEAGSTADGKPYLVMEYVDGLPITDYCDQKKLNIRQRLELFIRACEGVQHAHQKAVIHRDLKPANILVVDVDGQPLPRIIDFGLSKTLAPQLSEESILQTQQGTFLGTPGYMSPEQANSSIEDVDTRTDVYSLGVVLYVLLTGTLPFDTKKKSVQEMLRQLREDDPPRPSSKLEVSKETSTAAAEARGSHPGDLNRLLSGDLDWIAMKALAKEPNRRYSTPSDLAADIRRYLNNEPIAARPASRSYQLRKYVRRHRTAAAFAATVLVLLGAFTIFQARQLRRIIRERDRADRVTNFMIKMFRVSSPGQSRGNTITAREVLDTGARDIEDGLKQDSALQAQLMTVMGRVYAQLGLYDQAEHLLRGAAGIEPAQGTQQNVETLSALSQVLIGRGRYSEAKPLLEQAIALSTRLYGADGRTTLRLKVYLEEIGLRNGKTAEAGPVLKTILETQRRTLGWDDADTLGTTKLMLFAMGAAGELSDADALGRDSLARARRVFGEGDPITIGIMNNFGFILLGEGKFAEGERIQRDTLNAQRRVLGPDHPDTIITMDNLSATLANEAHYVDAENIAAQAVDLSTKVLGPDHTFTLTAKDALATALFRQGRNAEAETIQRNIIAVQQRVFGAEHPSTLTGMMNLAITLVNQSRFSEAEQIDRKVLEIQRRVVGPENPSTLKTMTNLGLVLADEQRYREAEELDRQTLDIERRKLGPEHRDTLITMVNLVAVLYKLNQWNEAEQIQRQALAVQTKVLGPDHPDSTNSMYNMACFAALKGRRDEAISRLQEALDHHLPPALASGMATDSDLASLRGDPRFTKLVALAASRTASARTESAKASPGPAGK